MTFKDDIDKYAKIWDAALKSDIFKDDPKPAVHNSMDATFDFFGQYNSPSQDQDQDSYEDHQTLNEEVKYWANCARLAAGQPIIESTKDKENVVKMATSQNPIVQNTVGKDQNPEVTQNWALGGKEHFDLEDLKVRLEKLESKLNATEAVGDSGKKIQNKIDDLKKQIDDLSDSMQGDRWSN